MNYVNEKCSGCGELFKEDDDIVVCPDCGSPHHRNCYKEQGHCANEDSHGEFRWEPSAAKKKTEVIPVVLDTGFRKLTPDDFGISPDEDIFGVSAAEFSSFINDNIAYYLPRFMMIKESGRSTFNPLCFIYPAGFFAGRKMWFWAILALIINMILSVPSMVTILAGLDGDASILSDEINNYVYGHRHLLEKLSEIGNILYFAICLIFSLTANRLYLKFSVKRIRRLSSIKGKRLTKGQLSRAGGSSFGNIIIVSMMLFAATFAAMGLIILALTCIAGTAV